MFLRTLLCLTVMSGVMVSAVPAHAQSDAQTVAAATAVLKELYTIPARAIPASLISEAHGVAIIPNTLKVGFVIGGQRGRGVVVVKQPDGSWRAPTFITITGGSVGFQIGAREADIVLVFKTQKSVDGLMKGKFTIGADASAAAGPVGRRAAAATDSQLKAEIFSYSRSRGLFAGISLDGSALQIDNQATAAYYQGPQGQVVPPAAQALVELIAQLSSSPDAVATQTALNAGPTPVGPTPVGPAPQPADPAALRQSLAQSATQMNGRLDDTWRQYLALPAEVYRDGRPPSLDALKMTLAKYDAVGADQRYGTLTQQPDFQTTRELLRAYIGALTPQGEPRLNLPPPPAGARR